MKTMFRQLFIVGFSSLISAKSFAQKEIALLSPDQKIQLKVQTGNDIHFQIFVDNKSVLDHGVMAINATGFKQNDWQIKSIKKEKIAEILHAIVPQKSVDIPNNCNELKLILSPIF